MYGHRASHLLLSRERQPQLSANIECGPRPLWGYCCVGACVNHRRGAIDESDAGERERERERERGQE